MDVDLERIKNLVKLVEKHHLEELTVEEDSFSVTIKGPDAGAHTTVVQVPGHSAQALDVSSHMMVTEPELEDYVEEAEEQEQDSNLHTMAAAMVGVFYRAPAPDEPNYIEVGDTVEVGQIIGLIEAMKVFSEIPCEVAGEVVEIPTANGKLVQQGEPLVIVRAKE